MRDTRITQARAAIRMTGADMGSGDTARIRCPFCDGGRSHDEAFYVTRLDNKVLYVCHRASCGARGSLMLTGCLPGPASIKHVPNRAPFVSPMSRVLPDYWQKKWDAAVQGEFGASLPPYKAGLYVNADWPEEAVWVLRDYNGQRIGVQTRRDRGTRGKVVRTYKEGKRSLYHFVRAPDRNAATWIVEDALSACGVASWGRNACALLGTYLHDDVREDITYSPSSGFIVALDPGAEAAAGVVRERLSCYTTRPVHVLYMKKDFKNMTRDEQFATLVRGAI